MLDRLHLDLIEAIHIVSGIEVGMHMESGRNLMDLVQALQQNLYSLREARAETSQLSPERVGTDPQEMTNNIIADVMNLLETLYVVINLPTDGFVSFNPGSQSNVNPYEEASIS